MSTNVDLVIVGSGTAAQSAAFPCKSAGWSVAVIDSRPFGGTCELRGCEPKKLFANAAELVDWSRRMQGYGIASATSIDWSDLLRFKDSFTDPVPASIEKSFKEAGIQTFHGRAHFVDHNALQVGNDTIVGKHVLIAAGARHATLNIPGEEYLTTSTQFMDLPALPKRVVFVGGGYIAFEFTHVAARAGASVHIINRGQRPLQAFDPDLVAQLVQATEELGVDIHLETAVLGVEKRGDTLLVHTRKGEQEETIEADLVVHAAGRVPEIDDLDLEKAGVAREKAGVTVNDYLQSTTNPIVYSAGDCVASGGLPLTPVSSMQASIVAHNLLHGNERKPNYTGIPSVVFTTPPLTRVGLSEEAAHEQGLKFTTTHEDTSQWYGSRRVRLPHSGFKVLVENESNRVLGAHIFGLHADEVINLFALAIRSGLPANDLKEMVYTFPNSASDINSMFG
jgi:glutathione reductase (NADPH)